VQKTVLIITHVLTDEHASVEAAYEAGQRDLDALAARIETPLATPPGQPEMPVGAVDLAGAPPSLPPSNMGDGGYQRAVGICKRYIAAGDVFQVVPSQRFELVTTADPFDIYRALRIVNPSPYMFYLQIEGGMLVGSSPEILCRVEAGKVINRPLAGTRRRGRDEAEDQALEAELLADSKDRAEHIMLVDLGRNDVGRVAVAGTIELPEIMTVERYSHVMHISSEVTGLLNKGCNCWDALRYTLPVGTVSGAPKVRAMQIIDELEPTRRGPYGGAVGYADFAGNMDMAIALRTMVVMPADASGRWTVHLQAGGGIVADSEPDAEHQETVNKAAALAKSVDLAEKAFVNDTGA
jgi:anthranilate synthase component 1